MSDAGAEAAARASALLELGRAVEAEQLMRTALQSEPNDPTLLLLLAQSLIAARRYDEAHESATRAVGADPGNWSALSTLAASASGRGKDAEALRAVQAAVDLAPGVADLHRQHAEILLSDGQKARALEVALRSRTLDPRSAKIAAVLADVLSAIGRHEEASAEARRALSLDPENAQAHNTAGYVQLRRGGGDRSVERYREALRLDPTSQTARHGLAAAIKSRNPIYRALLQVELWLETLPTGQRWAVRIGPLILLRLVSAGSHGALSSVVLTLGLLFVVITWAIDPVLNLILMTSPTDRALLTHGQRRGAAAFVFFGVLAIVGAAGATAGTKGYIPYAFGFGLWACVSGMVHTVSRTVVSRILTGTAITAAVAGIVGLVFVAVGMRSPAIAMSAVLFLSAGTAAWTTALVR
jgi:tetratricopeptide (TPR) repeat protein